MSRKGIPGPVATSCLTCKQRHKKCDMRQPTCLRCEQGDFECLGYSHIQRDATTSTPLKRLKPRRILPKAQQTDNTPLVQPATIHLRSSSSSEESSFGNHSPPAPEFLPGYKPLFATSSSSARLGHSSPEAFIQQQDGSTRALTTQDYLRLFSPKPYETLTSAKAPLLHRLLLNFNRLPPSPSDPILGYLNSPDFEFYIVSYFHRRMMEFSYFKPTKEQSEQLGQTVIFRLRSSQYYRWLTLLNTKICEAIVDGDQSQTGLHVRWIGDIETVIWNKLSQGPPPDEANGLRGDWLEVMLLKTVVVGTLNAYVILRAATPTFLQIVYALPDLWTSTSNPAFIPLMNIINSEHHRLATFTFMDSACAMLFGLPQQVEYDTRTGQVPTILHPHEWAHGSPIEFRILLSDINACRDKSSRARDWREIEHELVHWQSRAAQHDEAWESWMKVAWLAVQETWRLTLLAYLYLAVCKCPSDDPRIQTCVTQTLQVIGTVKKHKTPYTSVQFLIQYLMIGICARSEKHRKTVRSRLSDVNQTKFWIMRGTEFIPVLDYLWHSAGSDGRAITWDDYVRSREVLLPVFL